MEIEVEIQRTMRVVLPITSESEPFWRGLKLREVRAQKCGVCASFRHPARFICPECLSREYTWERLSGRAEVESFVWYLEHLNPHRLPLPVPPYNVAIVRLAEGPRVVSNVEDISFGELTVGDDVVASFEDVSEEWAILRFRLARGASVS